MRSEIDAGIAAQVTTTFRRGLLYADPKSGQGGGLAYEEAINFFTVILQDAAAAGAGEGNQAAGKEMLKAYLAKFLEEYGSE